MKIVVALLVVSYLGLHWFVKKSVDNHDHVGQNKRHNHSHWGEG